jgi:hypothetical protein
MSYLFFQILRGWEVYVERRGLGLIDRNRKKGGWQLVEVQVVMSAHAGWEGVRGGIVYCVVWAEGRAGVDG